VRSARTPNPAAEIIHWRRWVYLGASTGEQTGAVSPRRHREEIDGDMPVNTGRRAALPNGERSALRDSAGYETVRQLRGRRGGKGNPGPQQAHDRVHHVYGGVRVLVSEVNVFRD